MSPANSERLDGWKAIADYLGRDVRTAQRWRQERGLPVHRVPGGRSATVFAYMSQLDEWLEGPAAAHSQPMAALEDSSGGGPSPPGECRNPHRSIVRRWRSAAWAVLAGSAVVAGGILAFLRAGSDADGNGPVRLELAGSALVAYAADGSRVWSHAVLTDLTPPQQAGAVEVGLLDALRTDLDADRRPDFLAFLEINSSGMRGKSMLRQDIYGLSSTGKLLWTYKPDLLLTFAGKDFTGPWRVNASLAGPDQSGLVWTAFIHQIWWPSFVVRLDGGGSGEVVFVNSGHIEALGRVDTGRGTFLLAAGVNNEFRSAALAVLDERRQPATSPQGHGSHYVCERCPGGLPAKYLVFPQSEVNAALGEPYPFADDLTLVGPPDGVEVTVREHGGLNLRTVYSLSTDWVPQSVAHSDRYWETHRQLFESGKINHGVDACPERTQGVVVRVWEPGQGWIEMRLPST